MSALRIGPSWRVVSPSGGSTLMTSAPRSPSCCAAHGPRTTVVQSTIRTPVNGPDMGRRLLDDVISPEQERRPDRETERLRRLQIDDQLELRRLLEGKVCGLRSTGFDKLSERVHRRQAAS